MLLRIYRPPTSDDTQIDDCLVTYLNCAISYEYEAYHAGTGRFSLTLPLTSKTVQSILDGYLIIAEDEAITGQDILRVDGIDTSNGVLSITGHDLGVLLDRRYSLYGAEQAAGAQGYDIVEGTTAECVEHYLNNNIINPADTNRKIPLLIFRQNGVPGLTNDSYMARLQQLSVIVNDLCINAGIGYRFSTLAGRYLTFSLRQGVDRSADQSERGRVILSKNRRNVTALRFSENSENFFNAIYATGSSGADITRPVYRDATPPAGFDRCETAIDVAASDIDDIEKYALYETRDNIKQYTYDVEVGADLYRTKFDLGDIITILDEDRGIYYSGPVESVKKSIATGKRSVSITVGKAVPKFLNRIITGIYNGTQKRR